MDVTAPGSRNMNIYRGKAVLVYTMKTYGGTGGIAPLILSLDTPWKRKSSLVNLFCNSNQDGRSGKESL